MIITAGNLHFQILNERIRECNDDVIEINNCLGQRYIAAARATGKIIINGVAGNALGAYLDGCEILVNGNTQEATGDTMNDGIIYINGSSGDATGYAMRGGKIFVKGNAGYRTGIHMKAYKEKLPVIVIGGSAGSFLGEYQAGGIIIVLGIGANGSIPVGNFCGTGMHGGKMFIRTDELPSDLPSQLITKVATQEDLKEIDQYISEYCNKFDYSKEEIYKQKFYILLPNTKNPYKQLYTSK